MLFYDKATRSHYLRLNWMGQQLRVPIFDIGPNEAWSL